MKKSIEINNQQRIPFYNLRKSISFENCIQCEQNKYSCLCIESNIKTNKNKKHTFYNLKKSVSFENCIQCGQNKYSCLCIEFNTNNRIYTL